MKIRSKSKDRKRQIISTTLELLGTTSLDRLTTRQIAAALDISQPALFRHFRCKDDLILAVVEDTRASLAELARTVLAEESPREQLRILMEQLFAYTERHPGLSALVFSSALPFEGPVRHALQHIIAMQAGLVAELVGEGQRTGEFAADIEAKHAATAFIGLIQGTIFQWRLADQPAGLGQDAPALYKLWLHGVGSGADADDGNAAKTRVGSVSPGSVSPEASQPQIRKLDVRPIIAGGEDPQALISDHVNTLRPGSVLIVVAPFHPSPLVALLQKRGHSARVTEHGPKQFHVEVVIGGTPGIEDLRDLEPPEPLERVLLVSTQMEEAAVYLARLPRFPQLLLPHLRDRGLTHSIYEEPDGTVLLLLQKSSS